MQGGGGPLLTGTIEEAKAYNCHPELDAESVPQYEQVSNIGQTLKSVKGDNISSLRAVVDRVAIKSTLVLRLAFSCSTRGKRAYVLSALRTPLARAVRNDTAGQGGFLFRLVVKKSCSTLVDGTQCLYHGSQAEPLD